MVSLIAVRENISLGTVVVAVYERPQITSWFRVGYRWFNISWDAEPAYANIRVEWHNQARLAGIPLPPAGSPGRGPSCGAARRISVGYRTRKT